MLLTVVNGSPVTNALEIRRKIFPIKNRYVIDSRTLFPRSNLKTCFRHSDKKEKKKKRKEKSEYLANFFHP